MFYGNYAMQLQHEKVHLLERIANHLIIESFAVYRFSRKFFIPVCFRYEK